MIYLKKFNEDISREDLIDLCDTHLAYLIDEYFTYEIKDLANDPKKVIYIYNQTIQNKSRYWPFKEQNIFYWSDVKDFIIPLIEVLNKQYRVVEVKMDVITEYYMSNQGTEQKVYMEPYLSTLTRDRLDDKTEIKHILFVIDERPAKNGFIKRVKSLFESVDLNVYKSVPIETNKFLKSIIPDKFKVKIRPKIHRLSGIPEKLEIKIRYPSPDFESRSIEYNIREIMPEIEKLKTFLQGRYELVAILSQYYHGELKYHGNDQEKLIDFVTREGRVRCGSYTFVFSLIPFESKQLDDSLLIDELFTCCSDEGLKLTKKVDKGFLTINIQMNNSRHTQSFFRQLGDAIHQCIHFYKLRLVLIRMDGSTLRDEDGKVIFCSNTLFRTLEQWEELPKEDLTLHLISIGFEL